MKKFKDFINSLIAIWPLVYIVETHIVGVLVFGNMFIDFSSPTIDIVLHYIGIILAIAFCDIVLLLPSLTFISMGVFPSLGMLFSVPIYLLMNLFFLLGSESDFIIQGLQVSPYGFWGTLAICIAVTPLGYLNCKGFSEIFKAF